MEKINSKSDANLRFPPLFLSRMNIDIELFP